MSSEKLYYYLTNSKNEHRFFKVIKNLINKYNEFEDFNNDNNDIIIDSGDYINVSFESEYSSDNIRKTKTYENITLFDYKNIIRDTFLFYNAYYN